MKSLLALSVALIVAGNLLAADTLPPGRVVFFGDSITHAGEYQVDVECALLAHGEKHEVFNLGLPSETITSLTPKENAGHAKTYGFARPVASDRTDKTLKALRPATVFIAYGMNDALGMFGFADEKTATRRYLDALSSLRDDAFRQGAKRVICLSPTTHDPGCNLDNPKEKLIQVLVTALLAKKADRWEVVDFHEPMVKALTEARAKNPKFRFAADGIHPDAAGHALMAAQIVKHLFPNDQPGAAKPLPPELRPLVKQRQQILRDAWLVKIGHKRPGLAKGPTVEVAEAQADGYSKKIDALLVQP